MKYVNKAALAQLFSAIDEMNPGALKKALEKMEAAPSRTWRDWLGGGHPKVEQERLWPGISRGGRTPIGIAIESRWLEGVGMLAPLSNHDLPCSKIGSASPMEPPMLCVALGWREGLAEVIASASERIKVEALRNACERGDAASARVILKHAPAMPASPMADLRACERRPHLASPLHAAIRGRNPDCVMALLERGADPDLFWLSGLVHPIHMEVGREEPNWEITRLLLNAMEAKAGLNGEIHWPTNEKGRAPLMEIMSRPSRIAGALEFRFEGGDGKDILLLMARRSSSKAKDVDGNGWLDWAKTPDSFPESMKFKKMLCEEFDAPNGLASSDSAAPRGSVERAVERCLSEAAAISEAMASMTAAIEVLAKRLEPKDSCEPGVEDRASAFEALARSRSIIDKAEAVRGKLVELASKAPENFDKSASQAAGAFRRSSEP